MILVRHGMNLVAQEFIAAQDAAEPGMLVLSRFASAAGQLKEALVEFDVSASVGTRRAE